MSTGENYGVAAEDVPETDPTRYEERPELKAERIDDAAGQLEDDVNGGETIESHTDTHTRAVRRYATYLLLLPAAVPGTRRAGDAADSGESRRAVANDYKQLYYDAIENIRDVERDSDGDGIPEANFEAI